MPTITTSITVGGYTAIIADAVKLAGTRALEKANSIFCPTGPSPSRAWFLLTAGDVRELQESQGSQPLEIYWEQRLDGAPAGQFRFRGFYPSHASRVFPGGAGDPNALMLLELCDARAIAAKMSDSGDVNANVLSYASGDEFLADTDGETWATLCETLWDACGVLGAFPGLPYSPHGAPTNARFVGVNAWSALCNVLDKLDCAVAHHPLSNTYAIVRLGATQAAPINRLVKWSADAISFNATDLPETVRVYFRKYYKSFGQERDTQVEDNWSIVGANHTVDSATGASGAVSGSVHSIWDDLPAKLDEDNELDNESDLNDRASERKTNWLQRQRTTCAHKVLIGVRQVELGGQIRAVHWRSIINTGDAVRCGTFTEYISKPDLITSLDELTAIKGDASNANYAPSDLAQHSYPNYPRVTNIVQVYHDEETQGDSVDANADGVHPGVVRRWVAGNLATLEDCWIRFVDDHDNVDGDVSATDGEIYGVGRLCGVFTSGAETLPLYLVRKGGSGSGGSPIFSFTSTEAMGETTPGQMAATASPGGSITVNDLSSAFPLALSGAKGWGYNNGSLNVAMECQQVASHVHGLLPDFLEGDADFEIDSDDLDVVSLFPNNQQPVGTVTIKNPYAVHAATGSTFDAVIVPSESSPSALVYRLYQVGC